MTTATRAPDHIASLRDSFALHLEATRQPATARIYLDALDGLIRYLEAKGMPSGVGAIRREHIESYLGMRRETVKPATLSIEYRALAKFWRWAVDEGRGVDLADGEDEPAQGARDTRPGHQPRRLPPAAADR